MTTDRVIYTREGDWSDEFIQLRQQMMLPIETVDAMPYPFLPTIQQHQHHQQKQVLYYLLRHGQSTANVANIISSNRTALAYSTMHGLTNLGRQQARDSAAADLYRAIRLLQDGSSAEPAPNPSSDEPATASSQLEQNSHHHRVVFVSSPFARARQTALACRDGLLDIIQRIEKQEEQKNTGMVVSVDSEILLYDELVERWFGRLDGTAVETYAYVWPLDRFNVTHDAFGVESVAAVCTRIQRLMQSLERDLKDNNDNDNDNATNNDSNSNDTRRNSTIHVVLVSHADVLQIAQLYAAQAENVGEFSSFRFQSTCLF